MLHFSLKINTPIFKLINLILYKNGYFGTFQNFFFNSGEKNKQVTTWEKILEHRIRKLILFIFEGRPNAEISKNSP